MSDIAKELNQFYTAPKVAKQCVKQLVSILSMCDIKITEAIDPCAGTGAFFEELHKQKVAKRILGFDLDPKHKLIIKADYLKSKRRYKRGRLTVTNVPFGKRAQLAIKCFNQAAKESDVVALIVPIQFNKWSVQSKLVKDMKLIFNNSLEENSFIYKGKPYNVRCVFQIWVRRGNIFNKEISIRPDLRLKGPPIIKHPDFNMWQYNNTKAALKVFENDFDFAVPRQGFADYTRREKDVEKCEKTTQWILFKAKNIEVLQRLLKLDFTTLSKLNTAIPGFGKADVIALYSKLYG